VAGHRDPPLGLAGRGSARPTVFFFFFFFFFFFLIFPFGDLGKDLVERKKPTAGSCGKDLTRDQTHCSDPPRSKSTTGHRDLWLGLAGVGLVFFFFFFPFGGSDFFFFFFF
jgi:hypothetical protein